jgi:hypothetical protein
VGSTASARNAVAARQIPIRETWRAAFSPRDTRTIYDWAAAHVTLPSALSKTGAFDVSISRHFIAPFEALQDPHVREINVCAPPRDGKTLLADLWLPWIIENDPGPFLGVFQKDDIAKEHCELRTRPILQSVPGILARWPTDYRDRLQEMLFAEMPVFIWGPAVNNLQSKGFRFVWLDESWLYSKGTIGEAKARLGDFVKLGLDKFLATSQGGFAEDLGEKENRDWYDQFHSGELFEWHVQCRHCHQFHAPVWSGEHKDGPRKGQRYGMVWDDCRDDRDQWLIEEAKKTLRYICPHCGAAEKAEDYKIVQEAWNKTGRYQNAAGEVWSASPASPLRAKPKVSFHWNKIITYPWTTLLDVWLTARNAAAHGDRTKTIQFKQKELAAFHHPRGEDDDYEKIPTADIDADPATLEVITWTDPATQRVIEFRHRDMMIDVQMTEVYAVVSAWSDFGDDITLWAEKLTSWTQCRVLQERFKVADDDVGIDINYDYRATDVAQACCRHGHLAKNDKGQDVWVQWVAYRGSPKANFPWEPKNGKRRLLPYNPEPERVDPCPGLAIRARPEDMVIKIGGAIVAKHCRVFQWSEDTITGILDERRTGRAKAIKSLVAPGQWNEEFFKHMSAERMRQKEDKKGYTVYERYRTRADHFRDGKKMSLVHAIRRGRLNIATD